MLLNSMAMSGGRIYPPSRGYNGLFFFALKPYLEKEGGAEAGREVVVLKDKELESSLLRTGNLFSLGNVLSSGPLFGLTMNSTRVKERQILLILSWKSRYSFFLLKNYLTFFASGFFIFFFLMWNLFTYIVLQEKSRLIVIIYYHMLLWTFNSWSYFLMANFPFSWG